MRKVGEMRQRVIARDGGCVAPKLDPDADHCYDQWGNRAPVQQAPHQLEIDYVRHEVRGAHHHYASDHVTLCPGHHRGMGPTAGHVWATANRVLLRDYLERVCAPLGPRGVCQSCREPVVWHQRDGWVDTHSWEPHRCADGRR